MVRHLTTHHSKCIPRLHLPLLDPPPLQVASTIGDTDSAEGPPGPPGAAGGPGGNGGTGELRGRLWSRIGLFARLTGLPVGARMAHR